MRTNMPVTNVEVPLTPGTLIVCKTEARDIVRFRDVSTAIFEDERRHFKIGSTSAGLTKYLSDCGNWPQEKVRATPFIGGMGIMDIGSTNGLQALKGELRA